MKKIMLFLIMFLILFASSVYAQTWWTANQVTVAWDAVEPSQPTDTISYYVYLKFVQTNEQLGDIDTDNGKAFLEVADTQVTISFSVEGKYYVGVATKRLVEDGTVITTEINWSDINGESTPNPFGVSFYVTPNIPKNLRVIP